MTLSYQPPPRCKQKFTHAHMHTVNRRLQYGVLQLKNARYEIDCTIAHDIAPIPEPICWQITLPTQQELYIKTPRALLNALTQPQTTPAPSDVLLPQTQLGLILDHFSNLLSTLEQSHGTRFMPQLANQPPADASFLRLKCTIDALNAVFYVAIAVDGDIVQTEDFFKTCSAAPSTKSNIQLPVQVTVGFLRLAQRRMGDVLQLGAILIPQGMPRNPVNQLLGIYPHDANGPLIVVQMQRQDEHQYTASSSLQLLPATENPVSSAVSAADIPVTLTFVLSRVGVRADALTQIKEGFVFDAGKAVEGRQTHIDIMLNDRVIGHGELVQVGDNYGVLVHSTL